MRPPLTHRILSIFCAVVVSQVAQWEASASTALIVSVPDQKLVLIRDGQRVAQYKISTSKFGLGDRPRSYGTPLGKLEVCERIGSGLPPGAVLKGRQATGEVLEANAKGRDPIVTRILCLRGLEAGNENAHERGIYIHGTPVERTLGRPDSWGCIRMRSADIIDLFDSVPAGTPVEILNEPMRHIEPGLLARTNQAAPKPAPPEEARVAARTATSQPPTVQGTTVATRSAHTSWNSHKDGGSVTGLSSLGGLENLQSAQRHDPEPRRDVGLSLSIW